jgi:hypothetical protein
MHPMQGARVDFVVTAFYDPGSSQWVKSRPGCNVSSMSALERILLQKSLAGADER